MKSLTIFLLILGLSSLTTNAQNWPSFRGPNASGVAEGSKPPTTWDVEKAQNVLWRTAIPGLSHSSPIVSSYDAKTGTVIYQQRLPSSFSASPVAADGKLYLASEDGDVFVVKAGRQYELLTRNVMGQPLMATPALSQGMLILRGENAIYAVGEPKTAKN